MKNGQLNNKGEVQTKDRFGYSTFLISQDHFNPFIPQHSSRT